MKRQNALAIIAILTIVAIAPVAIADTMEWSGFLGRVPQNTEVRDGIEIVVQTASGGEQPSYDLGSLAPRHRQDCIYKGYDFDGDGEYDKVILGYVWTRYDGSKACQPYMRSRGRAEDHGENDNSLVPDPEPEPEPEEEPSCSIQDPRRCVKKGAFSGFCYERETFEQEVCEDENWLFSCGPWSGFPFETRDCGWTLED